MNTNDNSANESPQPTERSTSLVPFSPALPASYKLPTTKADIEALIANAPARPPAEIRQRLWFEAFGKEEWERVQQEAKAEYAAALQLHEEVCLRIEEQNHQIYLDNTNRKLARWHKQKLHKAKVDAFKKNLRPEVIATKLTSAVLRTFLQAKPAIRETFDRVWKASKSRRWPYPTVKQYNVEYKYFWSREKRCRALWSIEKGALFFMTPPFRTSFIKDLNDVRSPLVYTPNCEQSIATHLGHYRASSNTIFLRNFQLLDYELKHIQDFDWLWEQFEHMVRLRWEELIGIKLSNNWTLTESHTSQELREFGLASDHSGLRQFIDAEDFRPKPPSTSTQEVEQPQLPMPVPPTFRPPARPTPPPVCYDHDLAEEQRVVLQGALLANIEDNLREARQRLYATNNLRPHFLFGGIPFAFLEGQTRHYLCIGQSGAGKTTILRHLMSQFLPLTKKQTKAILSRSDANRPPRPRSPHEWARSRTFQTVVYNAKSENVPVLEAFGFNADAGAETDLFILDPNDSRCYAWDIAADIASATDAENFAAMLVPIVDKAGADDKDNIWRHQARRIITAVILSLRNFTLKTKGRQTWSFLDVILAIATPERMRYILQYHDTPNEIIAQLIDLSDAQQSSIYMSATGYVAGFRTIAEQWRVAEQQGRTISLTEWAQHGRNTVLVLPDTEAHVSYGPLNQALVEALTKLFLTEKYTFYRDADGVKRTKKRCFFIDEFGDAGHLRRIRKLFTQGRSFGVTIVAGLTDIPILQDTYGEKPAATILGLFSYKAMLKNEELQTQKWQSEQCGERLEKITKETDSEQTSHDTTTGRSDGTTSNLARGIQLNYSENDSHTEGRTDGTNDGSSRTDSADPKVKSTRTAHQGTNTSTNRQDSHGTQTGVGVNQQSSEGSTHSTNSSERHGTTQGKSRTWEHRKDFNIYPSQFGQFQDPATTGLIAGCYKTPAFTGWRADLPFAALQPEYEREDALDTTDAIRAWPDEWEVSKPKEWSQADYARLGLELPPALSVVMHPVHPALSSASPAFQERKRLTHQQTVEAGENVTLSHLDTFPFEED